MALLISEVEEYFRDVSGWLIDTIEELSVNIVSHNLLGGSWYITPEFMNRKKAITNINNDEDKYFLWCVLAHLNLTNSLPERVSHYHSYLDTFVATDLQYPVTLDQIPKFEKGNNLSIIVLGYSEDDNEIYS